MNDQKFSDEPIYYNKHIIGRSDVGMLCSMCDRFEKCRIKNGLQKGCSYKNIGKNSPNRFIGKLTIVDGIIKEIEK